MYLGKDSRTLFNLYKTLILESEDTVVQGDMIDPKIWPKLELKIQRCKYLLMKKSIFIGNVLARLKVCFANDIDTMAVDDYGNIYINPSYALKLTEDQVVGVLAHEAMHVITLSFFRKRGRNHHLWNIATDYIMNMYLFQDGFVMDEGGCDPVEKGDRWVIPELKGKKTVKDLDITEMSADKLYDIIKDVAGEPEDQKSKGQGPVPINVGDVIYDEKKGKYGIVTSIDAKTRELTSKEISEAEIDQHLQ
jgi:hypothetical protein